MSSLTFPRNGAESARPRPWWPLTSRPQQHPLIAAPRGPSAAEARMVAGSSGPARTPVQRDPPSRSLRTRSGRHSADARARTSSARGRPHEVQATRRAPGNTDVPGRAPTLFREPGPCSCGQGTVETSHPSPAKQKYFQNPPREKTN